MMTSNDLLKPLSSLGLERAPVAIAFLANAPAGLPHVGQPAPASCGYWKTASEGGAFYTTAADHGNCAVGAYTHGVELTPQQGEELQGLVGTMVELKYIRMDEVPSIPKRTVPMTIAAYAPLAQANFSPDVVVFRGNVRQIMILSEAARAARVFATNTVMGRPACAMLPEAMQSAGGVASVGCIGNRVYTGLGDNELYLAVPGSKLNDVLEKLPEISRANVELEKFHQQRALELA
jgi:uncharacterized protein (DUF169 family)